MTRWAGGRRRPGWAMRSGSVRLRDKGSAALGATTVGPRDRCVVTDRRVARFRGGSVGPGAWWSARAWMRRGVAIEPTSDWPGDAAEVSPGAAARQEGCESPPGQADGHQVGRSARGRVRLAIRDPPHLERQPSGLAIGCRSEARQRRCVVTDRRVAGPATQFGRAKRAWSARARRHRGGSHPADGRPGLVMRSGAGPVSGDRPVAGFGEAVRSGPGAWSARAAPWSDNVRSTWANGTAMEHLLRLGATTAGDGPSIVAVKRGRNVACGHVGRLGRRHDAVRVEARWAASPTSRRGLGGDRNAAETLRVVRWGGLGRRPGSGSDRGRG